MPNQKFTLKIKGMTCGHCEKRIERAVGKLGGVRSVHASFPKGQAVVEFDTEKVSPKDIRKAIEDEGYLASPVDAAEKRHPIGKVAPIFLIVLALYFIARYTLHFDFLYMIPKIDASISLLALFATGLFTSVHCIAMCGGINLSQSVGADENSGGRFRRPLLYNLGRVISYTVIGGIVGGIGSVISISTAVKGALMLAASLFMILMSLSMLGWIPHWLVPRLPVKWSRKFHMAMAGKGPFVVGLLNGLLPCGPLQAMQLYALSTGSVLTGALSMFLFSLGTVPLMLGAGVFFSMLKGKFSRVTTRVSAVLVMLIAVIMAVNAGGLLGWNLSASDGAGSISTAVQTQEAKNGSLKIPDGYTAARIKDGIQYVEGDLKSSQYPSIVVQKGMPVKFTIQADDAAINGCNGTVVMPTFNLQKTLAAGDNVFEFTPRETGTITYTCWMGMIRGKILVVDSLDSVPASQETMEATTGTGDTSDAATAGQDGTTSGDSVVPAAPNCCAIG